VCAVTTFTLHSYLHEWRWTLLNADTGLGQDFVIVEIFNIAYKLYIKDFKY